MASETAITATEAAATGLRQRSRHAPDVAVGEPNQRPGAQEGDRRRDRQQVLESLDRPELEEDARDDDPGEQQRLPPVRSPPRNQRPATAATRSSGPTASETVVG